MKPPSIEACKTPESHDLMVVRHMADRIAVMYDGKVLAIVADNEASRETLGRLMAGVSTS